MKMIKAAVAAAVGACALAGCNSMEVRQARPTQPLGLVCIQFNPAVAVRDFVEVLQAGFDRHGLRSQVINTPPGPECDASVTYTAERSWDFVPYLSLAELHLWQGGVEIGGVYYRHRNGMSLVKWSGTDTKMDPLIDELLAAVPTKPVGIAVPASPAPTAVQPQTSDCEACGRIGEGF